MGDQPVARPLLAHKTTQTQNKRTQKTIPPVGFETTISELERAKAVHALDCAATVIGFYLLLGFKNVLLHSVFPSNIIHTMRKINPK
jgi:hypothetical protein